jgi:predicted MFS family arabinose efflux permease
VSGTAIALCSRIDAIVQLQLLLFATGLGAGALIPVPTATVARWFQNRSRGGIALGVTMAGVGMGAIVFAPLFTRLILSLGWRSSFLIAGAMYFAIVSAAAMLLKPSGLSAPLRSRVGDSATAVTAVSRSRLLRAPQFVQVVAIMVVTTLSFQTLTVHLVPHAVDTGISQIAAAGALGFAGACSVPGRLGSGFLSERLGWGRTLMLSQAGMAVGMLALPFVSREPALFAVVGLYGLCQGIRAVSVIGVLGRVFGMRAVGELTGVMIAAAHGAGALGPYFAGFIYDRSGSYTASFLSLGIAILIGAILSLRLDVEPQTGSAR